MKAMLVTGASSGVGRALAIRAVRAGYAVYAVARNSTELEALRSKISASERHTIAIDATDIAQRANARGIVARMLERFGSIDVLVNNAGFVSTGALYAQDDDELQRQFGTHVVGPIALVREALGALQAARGHVLVVGSGVARIPIDGLGAYPAAKAALRSAATTLRRELAPLGVTLTYVDPGAIDTPFMKRAGLRGAPQILLVTPEAVARRMLRAVGERPPELNVVAWQTTLLTLAQHFPRLTEALLARVPSVVGGTVPAPPAPPIIDAQPRDDSRSKPTSSVLDATLEPYRRRMDKLQFRLAFVRELLVPGAQLDPSEVALRWAGMPNKHERAITDEVLAALADAGYLERMAGTTYRVLASAAVLYQ